MPKDRMDDPLPLEPPRRKRLRAALRAGAGLWLRAWRLLTWPIRWPVRFGIGFAIGSAAMALLFVLGVGLSQSASHLWQKLAAGDRPVAAFRIAPEASEPMRIRVLWQDGRAGERSAVLSYPEAAQIRADVVRALQGERAAVVGELEAIIERETAALEERVLGRIDAYADWYFRPWTFYELLWVQTRATAANVIPPLGLERSEMVDHALAMHMNEQYVQLVIQPGDLEPAARDAFAAAYAAAAGTYRRALRRIEADLEQRLLVSGGQEAQVAATFNWTRGLGEFGQVADARGGAEALARCTVVGLTGLAGMRTAAAPVASAATALASRASARLWGRLAGPASVRTAAAAGLTGLGAVLAGPLGVGAAIAGGLAVDLGFAKVDEARHRERFEREVGEVVRRTFTSARADMRKTLVATVDGWFDRSQVEVERAFDLPSAQLQPSTR